MVVLDPLLFAAGMSRGLTSLRRGIGRGVNRAVNAVVSPLD